ncbi:hypothetical protein HDU67_007027 [Dinochytrium kinnereticum]|nr:hypothetical protein HDU67_007027 [Dinochytrium kinnereticum]
MHQQQQQGDSNISGPLALGAGFIGPGGGGGVGGGPQLGRRPTNFGLHPSGSSASLTALNTDVQRRPSMHDVPTPVSAVPPMPSIINNNSGGGVMEVGLPTPFKPATAPVKSLFQSCMSLIEKLYGFPLFEFYLFPDGIDMYQTDPPPLIDPVAILWGCFRLGAPLCMLYNQLNPRTPLNVSDVSAIRPPKYTNVCKDNVYHFIVACKNDLGLSEKDVFSISELYKDDTNGFVKVMKTVNTVVEKIEARGGLPPKRSLPFSIPTQEVDAPTDNRSKLVSELIDTERKYIHDLEALQNYEKELMHQNILTRDGVHSLFANLDELLDFQRRFLIAMESTLSLPTNEQRIGQLFIMNEEFFSVYHAFCANYQFATNFALAEADKLGKLSNIIPPHMLQSYLIKPVQRVCKYPLLLQELVKLSQNTPYPYMDELKEGLDAIKRVTESVNEQKRVEENRNMKNELIERVEDWKGLQASDFGELLLADKFPMTSNDTEREYNLYLFERILLCCKDIGKSKRKSKKNDKDSGLPQYALKGNIYINSITGVQDTSDVTIGVFGVKVFWKDVVDMESFSLKCRNEEQVKLWKERLEKQVELDRTRRRAGSTDANSNPLGLLYNNNGQLRGATDEYPDSAYAASSFRPSFESNHSGNFGGAGGPQQQQGGYQSPALARSRSIPHNYYPQQQQQPPPPNMPPQRKSQLAMSRGYGSQADMVSGPPNGYYQGQRGITASPDPSSVNARGQSPPPPVPPMPQYIMPSGHSRFPSEGSISFMNQQQVTPEPHSPLMTRQQSQGGIPTGRGYTNSPGGQPSGVIGSGASNGGYFRHGSGQAGVNLPPPPTRTFSATAAALAAAASGGPPPAGYSDDDLSDDEYYAAQQRQRVASQQHQQMPSHFSRFNDSPTPQSPKLAAGNQIPMGVGPSANGGGGGGGYQQQRRSQHQQSASYGGNGSGGQRGLASGVPNINTSRKPSVQDEERGAATGVVSPVTPGNPFAPGWRGPPPPSHPPPPVPPIPQNSQQLGAYGRSASVPDVEGFQNGYPSTSPPTPQFLQANQQQHQRAAYSPSIKSANPYSQYHQDSQQQPPPPPPSAPLTRSPSLAPTSIGYGGSPKPPPMTAPPQMPLPAPPSSGPIGPPPSQPLPQAPPAGMRRAPTAPLPAPPSTDGPAPPTPQGAGYFKVRTHYESDVFVIAIPFKGASFGELQERIERKIRLCGAQSPADLGRRIRIRYRDEDGDLIGVNGDDDVALAFDLARRSTKERGVLNLYVQ